MRPCALPAPRRSLADLAARIRAEHEAVAIAIKRGLEHAINAGDLLIQAKARLAHHGQWLPWLKENCAIPERTAQHYMRLWRGRDMLADETRNVADLSVREAVALIAKSQRLARIIASSNSNSPLPTDRRFPVILADPGWTFGKGTTDPSRCIQKHYATMTLEDICALPVKNLATPDAALFLWAPSSLLPEALQVMSAWGFEYATEVVWVKDKIGMGHWVRNRHEPLFIGARGEMPHPAPGARPDSVIEAPRREHSRKPDAIYEMIERMYPDLPRIELFARVRRDGWDAWGNELPAKREAA
jgi:N6-adenosine-specific RNA methylase IME4